MPDTSPINTTHTETTTINSGGDASALKQAFKTILTAFLSAIAGAAVSSAVLSGVMMTRIERLEFVSREQIDEIKLIDKDGTQKVRSMDVELSALKIQYLAIADRQLIQIEKLARIETMLNQIDRNTP